jgi:hypothetical protein
VVIRADLPEQALRPAVIREALSGRVATIAPSTAIALLADIELHIPERHSLLREVIADAELEAPVRAVAIGTLARVDPGAARTAVTDLPDGSHELVAGAALGVLGRLGGPEDLPTVERIRAGSNSELVNRRASFAERLVAHRLGLTDPSALVALDERLPPPIGAAVAFVSAQPGIRRRTRALAALERELPWLDPGQYEVLELQCGARLVEVAYRADLGGADGRRRLHGRPDIPALVVVQSLQRDEMNLAYFVLSRPSGADMVSILVARPSGIPVYVGETSADAGNPLEAQLFAVRRHGATALSATVRLIEGGLEIYGRAARQPAEPPLTPERIGEPDERP